MGKILGFGKGQQGNTLRLNYKNYFAEIGLQNGNFVFFVNSEVVHNLGTMQTDIASKAQSASPVFTGVTTIALPTYASIAAAKSGGLTIGQLFQITTTGVVTVVNS